MNQAGWANNQANMYPGAAQHLNPQAMNYNFDVNQFAQGLQHQQQQAQQQQQQQQQQQNGTSQNPTPNPQQQQQFAGQNFNPASVVPAKRPHDGMSGSPVQPSQVSRSQTPSYGGYPNAQQPFGNAPTPYQHLQQPGSNNATPSPTMQNQPFRPPQQPRMNNASPSPFPQQQQPPQGNFAGQMPPGAPQTMNQGNGMTPQNAMAQYGQQYGMSPGMSMPAGMPNAMAQQMGNMANIANMPQDAQRQYQLKLMQHQQALRMQSGMANARMAAGQPGQPGQMSNLAAIQQQQQQQRQAAGQMANGQATATSQAQAQSMHLQAEKRKAFIKQLHGYAQQQGRQFNPQPQVAGKPLDLYTLFNYVISNGGSQQIERQGQWPGIAAKMQFPPNAVEEIKATYLNDVGAYERAWTQVRLQHKQDQARMHAQQMAGYGGGQQSPTKAIPGPTAQTAYQQQMQQLQQQQQQNPPPQSTPVQANAALPQNGMTTPGQLMGPGAGQHHRRTSSMRRPDQTTPQTGSVPPGAGASPLLVKQQRPPSVKQESSGAVMKSEEPQSSNYVPQSRSIESDGGYDIPALFELGTVIEQAKPNMPTVDEMGVIDTKAITLSLASGIHSEVRYALDTLVIITFETRVALNLEQCEDLLDVLIDCAEEQTEALSEEAVEVSDALDLPSYEDVLRNNKIEADTLQDVPEFGTQAYDLDRAADRLIAITTILRNFSFYEFNHRLLTSSTAIKWLSNTIRLLGTRNMLLRTHHNTQDFYKDIVIFLSNVTQTLEIPSREDALHLLHFLLAFAPQPAPSFANSTSTPPTLSFTPYVPSLHRYLPPAVDSLAKLLARQDPNRGFYRSIFSSSNNSSLDSSAEESPLDLLTRSFALSISILPDRTAVPHPSNSTQLRLVEARKAHLTQGMLAADILTTLLPNDDVGAIRARSWIESEDGWVVGLLNLAALLSVDRGGMNGQKGGLGLDQEAARGVGQRCLGMVRRLAERARKAPVESDGVNGTSEGDGEDALSYEQLVREHKSRPKWEGIPQGHAILGALMMPSTDKVALGLLCGLHEMAMQSV
ncbi:unnamed protein product [Zymoseptoria tritici ST99CH_1A5]|uniref:ARID domain-containing protein n=1 Tax=Zymoseptoria tritici ST99CH_1A5 TaxID=1276529 RepID=A0A1Y6LWZ5_ZYMTR|nr:unnamed protein product [Zymoseptoria tritici ST99CH_1A5]